MGIKKDKEGNIPSRYTPRKGGATRARDGQRAEAVATLHLAAALAEAVGDRETAHETAHALGLIAASDSEQ
jgi:hypothetical protein